MTRRLAATALVAVAAICLTAAVPVWSAFAATCAKPPVIAHRGGTERYPENTRSAFRWATDSAQAKWWEADVRFDATGTPYVIHNATLDPMTNWTGDVASTDLAAARAQGLRVDGGYYLPSLYEVLTDAAARGVQVQAELKVHPTTAQMAKLLARLDWTGMRSRTVVTSFDPAALDDVQAAAPDVRRGLIAELGWQDPTTITPHASLYSKHQWSVTADRLAAWRAAGLEVTTWTPDDLSTWRRMASYGVLAGVVTNRPNAYRLATVC